MFNWLKKKKPAPAHTTERPFSFIWFKEMRVGNRTVYTQPFRTTISARDEPEAREKLTTFAMAKMKLRIMSEEDFNNQDFQRLSKHFEVMMKQMDDWIKGLPLK